MPFFSRKEVLNKKLQTIRLKELKELAQQTKGTSVEIIKDLIDGEIDDDFVDSFIKKNFDRQIQERRKIISDEELQKELSKVSDFMWGVVQGQLDQKIQSEYVRKIFRFDDVIRKVNDVLHEEVTSYVVCTWFNHWTTVLIEDHIGRHPRVTPTLKKIKGVDIFFDSQPFDLKVTYMPKGFDFKKALENPKTLAIWLYENQGAQRFGSDNRLFVILIDQDNPERSWELKRDFNFVFSGIDKFFDTEKVGINDEVIFKYQNQTYTGVAKVLFIQKAR